jgi:hypothetical protein
LTKTIARKPKAKAPDPTIAWPTRERQRKGDFVEARTFEFEPDEAGRLIRKPVRTIRANYASVTTRLAKYDMLRPSQILAASMFERDHETGRLEPKVTVNLMGIGGGGGEGVAETVLDARDRKHHALNALRIAGPDVVRVVEDIVLNSASLTAVGLTQRANRSAALAWANLALDVGLNLLEAHYRTTGRLTG